MPDTKARRLEWLMERERLRELIDCGMFLEAILKSDLAFSLVNFIDFIGD
jgi:hypothetical protein